MLLPSTMSSRLLTNSLVRMISRNGMAKCALSANVHTGLTNMNLVKNKYASPLIVQYLPASSNAASPTDAKTAVAHPHDHSKHFAFERYWAAGLIPLFPAALFMHNPIMDMALAVAIGMHVHWGVYAVVQDYARPIVIGDFLATAARLAVYAFSMLMFAGLVNFNYNDVGITRAFEMVWAL